MSNSRSILPPDIREQVERKQGESPARGIGSRAPENAKDFGSGGAAPEQVGRESNSTDSEGEKAQKVCPNSICSKETDSEWSFCSKCGTDLITGGAERKLGIKLEEKDLQDYIFKGYVVKDLKVLGQHSLTVRSSQTSDLKEIDDYIINGKWNKDSEGDEKQVSDFMLRQMNALCLTAMAIQKFDGSSIGDGLEHKVEWLEERGSALVDIFATRVTLFNKAITEYLKKEDALLGS